MRQIKSTLDLGGEKKANATDEFMQIWRGGNRCDTHTESRATLRWPGRYLAGFGATLRVGDDLQCHHSVGFFLRGGDGHGFDSHAVVQCRRSEGFRANSPASFAADLRFGSSHSAR